MKSKFGVALVIILLVSLMATSCAPKATATEAPVVTEAPAKTEAPAATEEVSYPPAPEYIE